MAVKFEDVIIQEDATMLIYNISESLSPIILPCKENEQISFILLEDKYLLIDIKRCSECRFRLNVKPIAVEYECNSTLKMALGSLRLTKQSKNCEIQLQAPEAHRVVLKISSLLVTDNCSLSKIHLGPLTGVPVHQICCIIVLCEGSPSIVVQLSHLDIRDRFFAQISFELAEDISKPFLASANLVRDYIQCSNS
ncbi:protocadherin Fat 1 [Caerostris extrusa]|uniref:Protocadherin Fat 1 n=1 Tax=Caerostris extrusa TaxID=172846 RepID=A0AAV4P4R7_CAEEX|nr:protocadherin Fat 1 [Caerostris extrusa]